MANRKALLITSINIGDVVAQVSMIRFNTFSLDLFFFCGVQFIRTRLEAALGKVQESQCAVDAASNDMLLLGKRFW